MPVDIGLNDEARNTSADALRVRIKRGVGWDAVVSRQDQVFSL